MAIIKSMTRKTGGKNYSQLIEYMLKGQRETAKTKDESFIIRHNIQSENVSGIVKEFKACEDGRKIKRSNSVKIYHEVYAIGGKDKTAVTPEMLRDLAERYISMRNPHTICLAVPHFTENPHIHFMFSGVELDTGNSLRISRDDFYRFKQDMLAYEKLRYPQLQHSIKVQHGKKQRDKSKTKNEREYHLTKRTYKSSEKEHLKQAVEAAYLRSLSRADFMHRLSVEGIHTYSRHGAVAGISGDRNYSFRGLGLTVNFLKTLDLRESALLGIQVMRDKEDERDKRKIQDVEIEDDIDHDTLETGTTDYKERGNVEQKEREMEDYMEEIEPDFDIDL
ncbi:MAG: relaxase/mobilization nuclease domain-containing protein [Bacteroidetes bacterium]|nr:relaxase/mobilization nuclease domain-containing protein [Bacteroidota bacterium]